MRIDPAGWPFIGGAFALGLLTTLLAGPFFGAILFLLTAVFLVFFRDPERAVT